MDRSILITTSNGLKILAINIPDAPVEYCGVLVNTGSRDEKPGEEGLAHFIEHTVFKGTVSHKSSYISSRMEDVGGELNAYTTKEETVVYSIIPKGYLTRAVNLISEIVIDSQFPEAEINKEREVIREEILSYRDSPAESIYDDFDEIIFKDSALAHNILGTEESINRFTSEICRTHLKRFYTAPNMLFFYMGATPPDNVVKIADNAFSALPVTIPPFDRSEPEIPEIVKKMKETETHQSHTIIGTRIPGMFSSSRHAYALLNNILAGPGMNSLLNMELRERRGLVYSVDSSTSMFTDSGALTIYFGCDPHDTKRCISLIDNTLSRLAYKKLSAAKLQKAQRQYLGQLVVARDNREQVILGAARSAFYYNNILTSEQIESIIHSISGEDIRNCAESLLSYSSLTIR